MSARRELSGGHHVVLCAPDEVFEGHRKPIKFAAARLQADENMRSLKDEIRLLVGDDEADIRKYMADHQDEIAGRLAGSMELINAVQDAQIVARVRAWSFELPAGGPLPISQDGIFYLLGAAYDEIVGLISGDALEPDLDVSPDPASPTQPSTA